MKTWDALFGRCTPWQVPDNEPGRNATPLKTIKIRAWFFCGLSRMGVALFFVGGAAHFVVITVNRLEQRSAADHSCGMDNGRHVFGQTSSAVAALLCDHRV
jgi:hypothetical protein